MQFNERIKITSNSTHFFLNSNQAFRCNNWLSNVCAILDGHHIVNNLYIRVLVTITYGGTNITNNLETIL